MGQHEWTRLELGTVYLCRILLAKTTVSVVCSNTSGCFPGALNTQLWKCAMFLSLCLPCWQKGTSLFSYCFELLMILQNLKCLRYIVPLIWKHLFNLLYLISLWYNFLDQSLWGKNKNKTLGHVPDSFTVSSASFQPQGHSRWTAGDAGGNKHGAEVLNSICSSDVLFGNEMFLRNPCWRFGTQCSSPQRWLDLRVRPPD